MNRYLLPVCLLFCSACFGQMPELVLQTGYPGEADSLALSHDGRLLAVKLLANRNGDHASGAIRLWDTRTGKLLSQIATQGPGNIVFSADDAVLASSGPSGSIQLWDLTAGKELALLKAHSGEVYSVALSPNGKLLASASADKTIKLWDFATRQDLRTLTGHTGTVYTVAFSPDGDTLASGGGDRTVRLWDVASGAEKRLLQHSDVVFSVAFSKDGTLASGGADGRIRVWDATTTEVLPPLSGHVGGVYSVVFSLDGKILASGGKDKSARLWDFNNQIQILSRGEDWVHASEVLSVAFGRDGKFAAGTRSGTISLLDLADIANPKPVSGFDDFYKEADPVSGVGFSADGRFLATEVHDHGIKIWDLATGAPYQGNPGASPSLYRPKEHTFKTVSMAFGPEGHILAVGDGMQSIELVDVSERIGNKGMFHRLGSQCPDNTVSVALAWSADGKRIAGGHCDGVIQVWEKEDALQGLSAEPKRKIAGHDERARVAAVAFHPDGNRLASGGSDRFIKLWNIDTGKLIRTFGHNIGEVHSLAFSPDGATLASGSDLVGLELWNTDNGDQHLKIRSASRSLSVNSVVFSPRGDLVATGDKSGVIEIWDVPTETRLHWLTGHSGAVNSVAFSPNGKILASGGRDATIKLWDVCAGKELLTLLLLDPHASDPNEWLVVTPDGLFDGSQAAWSQILLRFSPKVFDVLPIESLFYQFYYPGLLAEILAGRQPQAPAVPQDRRQPQVKLELADNPTPSVRPVSSRTVRVRITVEEASADKDYSTGSGAQDVRLFRNGSLVHVWHGEIALNNGRAMLDTTIPLTAGDNHLRAYALNRQRVKSSEAALDITGNTSLHRKGVAYVIAVGVNEYAVPDRRLRYAVADARGFAEEMWRQQSQLRKFVRTEVITLFDRKATRKNVLLSLELLSGAVTTTTGEVPNELKKIRRAEPEDAVIVYLAGHGRVQNQTFYMLLHDSPPEGRIAESQEITGSVSDRDLQRAFEKVDAGLSLLIVDACESGQALESGEKYGGALNSNGLARLAFEKGMYILAAAQSDQNALEKNELGHGYLTWALIEGLRNGGATGQRDDPEIELREWLDDAALRVPEMQKKPVEGDANQDASLQRPRVFYRSDSPLLVVGTAASSRPKQRKR